LWRNVISKDFLYQLGLTEKDLKPCAIQNVATAKKGANLAVLGEVRQPLKMQMGGLNIKFKTHPVVIEHLTMPMNICGPFMKAQGIDQLHSRDALRIRGQFVPLSNKEGDRRGAPEAEASAIFVTERCTVKANSVQFLPAVVQEIKGGAMPPGDGFASGSVGFQDSTDLSPWTHTVVKPDEGGNTLVGTFNTRPEDIVVQKGQKYGTFRRMCTIQEVNKTPWRICAIGTPGEVATSDSPGEEKSAKFKQGRRGKSSKERRSWLQEEFKLKESECLLTTRDVEEATDLLMDFWDVFSHDGSYGKTNLIQHEIHTEDPSRLRTDP
jgi:hypothetical protein